MWRGLETGGGRRALASLSVRFVPSYINSIVTVNAHSLNISESNPKNILYDGTYLTNCIIDFVWLHDICTLYAYVLVQLFLSCRGPRWLNELGSWIANNSHKPITNTAWLRARLCKLQKGCTRLATASDKVDQFPAYGRWFSPGTPATSNTKIGRHDIAEILLKVALNTINKSINQSIMPMHDTDNCTNTFL
jgi:hypothetical protein